MNKHEPPKSVFAKSFTQQDPIPEDAIERAVEIMRSGRLHRYNTAPGETSEAALLEEDYARYQDAKFCLACTSGGFALQTALRATGVTHGTPVLANAYTLAPVPGAIHNTGGKPVFVEIDANYHIDIADFSAKAESSGAKHLMLSHMRGHISDMAAIVDICERHGITMIEDCAHTMGARWKGTLSGNFGAVACFSTQTYKHINSGEGGLLTTNDPDIAARAILHSGSYMLYERHGARPEEDVFTNWKYLTANFSGRLDNLRASLIRTQIPTLQTRIDAWNERYRAVERRLKQSPNLSVTERASHEEYVGSSIQFRVTNGPLEAIPDLLARCASRGVDLKWFGETEPRAFTSRYDSWRYFGDLPELPQTLGALSRTIDMRLPLTFTVEDCEQIASIIADEAG